MGWAVLICPDPLPCTKEPKRVMGRCLSRPMRPGPIWVHCPKATVAESLLTFRSQGLESQEPHLSMVVGRHWTHFSAYCGLVVEIQPLKVNYHDDIYGPEVHEVGPHVVSCMLYIQVIAKA